MPQNQKRRSQASDTYALGTTLPLKYKAHTRDSWNTWEVRAQFLGTRPTGKEGEMC